MRVLGVIPARGGSKGIPRKNIRLLCGKPLLAYTAEAALRCNSLDRVILSTEDEEIADVGRSLGLDVPFIRPKSLASDDTPTLPVLLHAVRTLEEEGDIYDAICLLQPTNPLRTTELIDNCITLLEQNLTCTSVVTVLPVPLKYNPHWVFFEDGNGYLVSVIGKNMSELIPRRQLLPPAFHREGSIYLVRREILVEQNSLYGANTLGVIIDISESINIDIEMDWIEAERRFSSRK